MSTITSLIQTLNDTEMEIKKTGQYLTKLKKTRDELEHSIIIFLEAHNLPGFKYEGKIYQSKDSRIYKKKKKNEKEETIKDILKKSGATLNDEIVTNVFQVFKSKPIPIQRLKVNSKLN